MNEWVMTFLDSHNGGWVSVNGKLGCFSVVSKDHECYDLGFCVKNESTRRRIHIVFHLDSMGLRVSKILGKRNYKEGDLIPMASKIAEVIADYEGCGRR